MNNAWGSVCNNRFGTNDAVVVCRQLGFPTTGAVAIRDRTTSMFEISLGPVFLDQLDCRGSETNLMKCGKNILGLSECDATEIAGVQCIGEWSLFIDCFKQQSSVCPSCCV